MTFFIRLFKAFIYKQVRSILKLINIIFIQYLYSNCLQIVAIVTGHFALKKGLWKHKVKNFLEEFLCRYTRAREKVKKVEKIEADETEKQKKEKSVDACRSSDDNIHCVGLESENCLIVALKNTPLKKLVGPPLCNSSSLFISDLP